MWSASERKVRKMNTLEFMRGIMLAATLIGILIMVAAVTL
jgi:hypothetical protein